MSDGRHKTTENVDMVTTAKDVKIAVLEKPI